MAITTEIILKFKKSAANQIGQAFKGLTRDQRALVNEFRTGNKTYREAVNGLKDVSRGYDDAREGAEAFVVALKAVKAEQRAANQTRINEDRFDTTSRQVALAGDVQSNLGALSGLSGAAGAGGAAQGIGLAGELIVLTEELPRLKEAVKGLPSAANAAGKALGLGGGAGLVGAMGLTAVAVAAVSVAFNHASKQIDAAKVALESRLSAELSINQQLATLTTEQINERTRQLEIQKTADAETLANLEAGLDSAREKYGDFAVWIAGLFGLNDKFKEVESSIADAGSELNALADAAESTVVQANDAEEARQKEALSINDLTSALATGNTALTEFDNTVDKVASGVTTASQQMQSAISSFGKDAIASRNAGGHVRRPSSSGGGGFILNFKKAAQNTAKAVESGITDAYKDANEERRRIVMDFNADEIRLKKEALFAQKQDLQQFKFDQKRLLETGDFTSAFNRQREKAFQQGQDRDRIIFDQSQRRNDLTNQIQNIVASMQVNVNLQPNAMFNANVTAIATQASVGNRSF